MNDTSTVAAAELIPSRGAVLELQGIPRGHVVPREIESLCDQAMALFVQTAEPAGIIKRVSAAEFATIYAGEGRNEPQTPVAEIFPRADRLALIAVTLGPSISREISERFQSDDLALACMLDAVASVAADHLAETVQQRHVDRRRELKEIDQEARALRYSPGYCGWHLSGQRALFGFLDPEPIGLSLRDSFLMDPLKSVSGVVLIGAGWIHAFDNAYPFCTDCHARGCRERMDVLGQG